MGSTRLPGKVMKPLAGEPLLRYVIERARRSRMLDAIILATTTSATDDRVADFGRTCKVRVFRGEEDDVLGRFTACLDSISEEYVLLARINADNPLVCPEVIDHALGWLQEHGKDVVTPFINNTYPFGSGVEVSTVETLRRLERLTKNLGQDVREHLYSYAYAHQEEFNIGYLIAPSELARPQLNLSVDTQDDFEFVERILLSLEMEHRLTADLATILTASQER